jgi:dihydropteroate synthase
MGILNITPDSFSDGGRFLVPEHARAQAARMIADGADIIDIGAESTRPYGAQAISAKEELARLQPVLADVVALGIPVSIDSMKSSVVAWALGAGAAIANDVWGLQRDPAMAQVVADHSVPVIVMHNRDSADPAIDIMSDIAAFFARSLEIAAKAGIAERNIVLDPGIGFGKTPEQSMIVLARLNELNAFGLPLLIGASRKRFISTVSPSEPQQRLGGSIAAHLLAAKAGARIIRTHDVAETVQALRVTLAIEEFRPSRRDGARDRGRPALRDRSRTHRRPLGILAHRSPRRHRVLFQCGGERDRGVQERQLQAAGTRRRGRRRGRAVGVPARHCRQGHGAQAARADRGDLRRRRRDRQPRPALAWLRC